MADSVPFEAFELLIDQSFSAVRSAVFLELVDTDNTANTAVNNDLGFMRDIFCDLPRLNVEGQSRMQPYYSMG